MSKIVNLSFKEGGGAFELPDHCYHRRGVKGTPGLLPIPAANKHKDAFTPTRTRTHTRLQIHDNTRTHTHTLKQHRLEPREYGRGEKIEKNGGEDERMCDLREKTRMERQRRRGH